MVVLERERVPRKGVSEGEMQMLEKMPNMEEINALVGTSLCEVWTKLCAAINEKYDMECLWNNGGKAWDYEYKYRRGGKTLCALYAGEGRVGFVVIFGKLEREKFENAKMEFSEKVRKIYDEAKTYHDGKWMMFLPEDATMFADFMRLLEIKRKPNRT